MAIDKTKVFSAACHVYMAKRSDPSTAVAHSGAVTDTASAVAAGWKEVGLVEAGSAKAKTESVTTDTQVGVVEVGKTGSFDVNALEVDATNVTELETVADGIVDVLMVPVAASDTRVHKLLGLSITVNGEYDFGGKSPAKLPIHGTVNNISALSDFITETTLAWKL